MNKLVLVVLYLLFLVGNLGRYDLFNASYGAVNLIETSLFILSIVYMIGWRSLSKSSEILILSSIIGASTIYGSLINPIDFSAIAYAIRLILLLLSSLVIANAAWTIFQYDIDKYICFILYLYCGQAITALMLFLIFPNSIDLFDFLKDYNINFIGDPHENRLISTLMDPNFYGNIVCLPITLLLFSKNKYICLRRRIMLLSLFAAVLLLTFSRSAFLCLVILLFLCAIVLRYNFIIPKLYMFVLSFFLIIGGALFVDKLTTKFLNYTDDPSYIARFDSFDIGLNVINEVIFFGYGYNYGLNAVTNYKDGGLDSSPQVVLSNFGILGMVLLLVTVIPLVSFGRFRSQSYRAINLTKVYFYVSVIIVGNFNNLLFYPYWILSVFPILIYAKFHQDSVR